MGAVQRRADHGERVVFAGGLPRRHGYAGDGGRRAADRRRDGLTKATVEPILSAALIGAVVRAFATPLNMLLAVWFMARIGLVRATPCFISLASENALRRRRAMAAASLAGWPRGRPVQRPGCEGVRLAHDVPGRRRRAARGRPSGSAPGSWWAQGRWMAGSTKRLHAYTELDGSADRLGHQRRSAYFPNYADHQVRPAWVNQAQTSVRNPNPPQ